MKKLPVLCCTLLASALVQAAAPVEKIEAMLAKPAILCGKFEQTKQLAGMKKPLLSTGRFCVVQGKGVLWRTLQPFPATLRLTKDEIVNFQGDRVAMRLDAKTEPTVRMINSVLFSMLAGDLSQLGKLFESDGAVEGKGWHVALKAREPALAKAVGAITLSGDNYVRGIRMDEAGGDHTAIVFSDMQSGEQAMQPEEAALF
ncbi:MAG TPA: outer membrane lipoprotein carrier protein LolA [Burkholderiaceae bacterium]